jgi:hypothetical protein
MSVRELYAQMSVEVRLEIVCALKTPHGDRIDPLLTAYLYNIRPLLYPTNDLALYGQNKRPRNVLSSQR